MTLKQLKKKRNFSQEKSFTDSKYVSFHSSKRSEAYDVMDLFKELRLDNINGVCGSPSVGGYYVSAFSKKEI